MNEPVHEHLSEKLARIRLVCMDVDGTLTDGTLGIDDKGAEQKRFHVADGMGIVLLRMVGIEVCWISGRASEVVEQRAKELSVPYVYQGIKDKARILTRLANDLNIPLSEIAHIGDDWNDLSLFQIVGLRVATANADAEVKKRADFVTQRPGGYGAVRDLCDRILAARGEYQQILELYLDGMRADLNPTGTEQ